MSKYFHLALIVVSVSAKALAITPADELGSEVYSERACIKTVQLNGRGIDSLDGLDKVAQSYPGLDKLTLRGNAITEVPDAAFAGFERLVNLDLGNNQIRRLQDEQTTGQELLSPQLMGKAIALSAFAGLRMLRVLDLSGNHLSTLPQALSALPLRSLNLANNQFASLPQVITKLSELMYLSLRRNYLSRTYKPSSILPAWLRRRLFDDQQQSLHQLLAPLRDLEVVELGSNGGAGPIGVSRGLAAQQRRGMDRHGASRLGKAGQ